VERLPHYWQYSVGSIFFIMNCHPYFLIHTGNYLGGVDLDEVTPIDLKSPYTVYVDSGDY